MQRFEQKLGLTIFACIISFSLFFGLLSQGSKNAVNSLWLRGESYGRGKDFQIIYPKNFDFFTIPTDNTSIDIYIFGEIANPSWYPVILDNISFNFYINNTFLYSGYLNGTLIPSNRYLLVNTKITLNKNQLSQYQIDQMNHIIKKRGNIEYRLNGVVKVSSILYSGKKEFQMINMYG